MVWKKSIKIFVFLALAVILAMPISASADTVYDEGNISTTYITIFKDIAKNIGVNDDYVFFRSGQYEYKMVVGDIDYFNPLFSGNGLTIYTISTTNSGYSSSAYNYSVTTGSFYLDPGTALIYSNLGNYPELTERGDFFEISQNTLLLVGLFVYLLRSIFAFCLRDRG